ncbi:MAG: DinB family protein [Chloroflexi bacterium]|nr:DinB family protein [Chloroflexota bacterium]
MKTYDLYVESGPKHMKTMVHVPRLLGCVAVGPTTDAALAATPDAIRTYLRFLRGCGERVAPDAPFKTRVAEHVTEGMWLGNGSPYVLFAPDLQPVSGKEIETLLGRYHRMRETLALWAESRTARQLDAMPKGGGRTARAILLHVAGSGGGYLSPVVGGVKGFSAVHGGAERGEIAIPDALRRVDAMAAEVVRATTPAQRSVVIRRPKEVRTLRKALRRMLEHDWEHLVELSRRPGGPEL